MVKGNVKLRKLIQKDSECLIGITNSVFHSNKMNGINIERLPQKTHLRMQGTKFENNLNWDVQVCDKASSDKIFLISQNGQRTN